jgi:hypothetical protein
VLDPPRGAMSGVGPPLVAELDVVVVPVRLDEVVLEAGWLGGGGLDETVRTARIGVVATDADGFWTAGWDVFAGACACTFAVVACLAVVRGRRVEFRPGVLFAVDTEPACSAAVLGAAPGKPCTTATAAPTASAPPRAPIVAHDSDSFRRAIDGFSHRRAPRARPSSAAQKATPPYRLAAT